LVALLLRAFPPESDPQDDGRARFSGPDDEARRLRAQLISWLGDQCDMEAVEAIKLLERQFGAKYPWLRRPRATAERGYRLASWMPVPPQAVAKLLAERDKRLIRSGSDAVAGVIAAIRQFERRLRHEGSGDLDSLWNTPTGRLATPKEEEQVSTKLCDSIRDYFREYAVGAEREVEIYRRLGGVPGSEVDILCRVLPVGAKNGDTIIVPIEVKLSHNREARTGLRGQLVDRYMSQLGTSLGVFVLVWMGSFDEAAGHQPLWDSPAAASEELKKQARDAVASCGLADVQTAVIDASLPTVPAKAKAAAPNQRPTLP
jgi:hypothetical protein